MHKIEYKELHLLRHAKSSWEFPDLSDFDRPLNSRGKKACLTMAHHITALGGLAQNSVIYCSPAVRAQQTISRIVKSLNNQIEWITQTELYTFDKRDLIEFCRNVDNVKSSVTIVGHNPALHELLEYLTGERIEKLPTCAYSKIVSPIPSWEQMYEGCGTLKACIYPKMFE